MTIKYYSDHRKHRYELVDERKEQSNRIFVDEKLEIRVILVCRTTSAHKCRKNIWIQTIQYYFSKRTISADKHNGFI